MSNLLSRIIPLEDKSVKKPKQGNGIAIFCGIVSIVTCCYSCNLAFNRYEEAKNHYIQASRLIKDTGSNIIKQTGDQRKKEVNASAKKSPFI